MMRRKPNTSDKSASPWPHRLAWVLACATFLLINVGGTVTTYDAGMAVPDWPTTEGEWLYPVPKWLGADWDVFLEHGHRLLGVAVGVIVIALVVTLWTLDRRKWMRWLGLVALAGVILQGVLGGFRVWWDELLLAKIHGCTAPLFFAFCSALVGLTSSRWQHSVPRCRRHCDGPKEDPAARGLHRLTLVLTVGIYLQIVLGAQLRHVSPQSWPGWFELWVWLKLIAAGLLSVGVVWLLIRVLRRPIGGTRSCPTEWAGTPGMIAGRAKLLAVLFFLQLVLGAGTWATNFGLPVWFKDYVWAMDYTVVAVGRLQVLTTTAHAAVGSLNLVTALSLAMWSRRVLRVASG